MWRVVVLFLFVSHTLLAGQEVDTIYGTFDVEEPVLIELLDSPAMQRLKGVHQYGVEYFIFPQNEYTRWQHSLGVWALLREHGCSLEEQIAGLLHDASHTAFSHLGDFFFQHFSETESYQDSIHEWFLKTYGLAEILERHGIQVSSVLHKEGYFPALEQDLPHLCADRIDYNLQGGFLRGDLTEEQMNSIYHDLRYADGQWSLSDRTLARALGSFSLKMSLECWSGVPQALANSYLCEALARLIDLGEIGLDEIHFGTDQDLWDRLARHDDPAIQHSLAKIQDVHSLYILCDEDVADEIIPIKCRGIDPFIRSEGKLIPLSIVDEDYAADLQALRDQAARGWAIQLTESSVPAL